MSVAPVFPNYLEADTGEETAARINAFVPLEFAFEKLKVGDEIRSSTMSGARAEVDAQAVLGMMTELAEQKDWEFHSYADGSCGFIADVGPGYLSIHLKTAEDGSRYSEVVKRSERYQEMPDWLIKVKATVDDTVIEVLRFDPKDYVPPKYDGSVHSLLSIPEGWDPFWSTARIDG
ncbi:MAG: hypothetical protein WC988_02595 [Patescibacteria group bacterium]